MQRIIYDKDYIHCHSLLSDFDRLYTATSGGYVESLLPCVYDSSFSDLIQLFEDYSDVRIKANLVPKNYKPIEPDPDNKTIIVCFSGGKDSYATARYYQKLDYNVVLFHVRGINRGYHGEHLIAEEAANHLGLPIEFQSIKYDGTHNWIEHPMKNIIIANMALTLGVMKYNTTKIAFGSFSSASLIDNEFDVCGGDCVEVWSAYEVVINQIIHGFQIYRPNLNYQTALELFATEPDSLKYVMSCMTPTRFRNQFRNRVLSKFNIDLLPNRCGCCWKCCVEYIWLADHDVLSYDESYYIYCLEILAKTIKKETGYNPKSIYFVWDTYFFYPISQSKAWEQLYGATISYRKINTTN